MQPPMNRQNRRNIKQRWQTVFAFAIAVLYLPFAVLAGTDAVVCFGHCGHMKLESRNTQHHCIGHADPNESCCDHDRGDEPAAERHSEERNHCKGHGCEDFPLSSDGPQLLVTSDVLVPERSVLAGIPACRLIPSALLAPPRPSKTLARTVLEPPVSPHESRCTVVLLI